MVSYFPLIWHNRVYNIIVSQLVGFRAMVQLTILCAQFKRLFVLPVPKVKIRNVKLTIFLSITGQLLMRLSSMPMNMLFMFGRDIHTKVPEHSTSLPVQHIFDKLHVKDTTAKLKMKQYC